MKFFDPDEAWLDWAAAHSAGRPVADVGCGEGHVALALRRRGCKVLAIDALHEPPLSGPDALELLSCWLTADAERLPLLRHYECLVLFCRPCHGGFVARVLDHLYHKSEALYVGLPANLECDLKDFGYEAEEIPCPPCAKEKTYRIVRRRAGQPAGRK